MNRSIHLLLVAFFLFSTSASWGQSNETATFKKEKRSFPKKAVFDPGQVSEDYHATLHNLEAPYPGGSSYRSGLMELKEKVRERYPIQTVMETGKKSSAVPDLIQGKNFSAFYEFMEDTIPLLGGRPSDNTLAISDDGRLLTSYNSQIWGYDVVNDTFLFDNFDKTVSFSQFATGFTLFFPFDPKLVYDPLADRFIITFLTGRDPDDSGIIIGFSSTNNPSDPWNVYELDGSPFNDSITWTDYPAIALTEDELFLTINLLREGEPWQTGFEESLIWQIDLEDGYTGETNLATQIWSDIDFGGAPIRNLNPIQGGRQPYGPNIYLLSNRNFAVENDTIFLIEVTGTIDDPNATLEVQYGLTDTKYGAPPVARQANDHEFDTNDGRVLGGFLENDRIQYVGNTVNPATGLAAVYHGFIDNVSGTSPTFYGNIIGDADMDFGYPNIAYTGKEFFDTESIIIFDHTSPTVNAGYSAIHWANEGEYSDVLTVVDGETYVDRITGLYDRWGDYSGIQRKYNEPGTVWSAAYYGYKPSSNFNSTWVSEIISPGRVTEVAETAGVSKPNFNVYPNPTTDRVEFFFTLEQSEKVEVALFNLEGRLVKKLLRHTAGKGKNVFEFSTQPLTNGIYLLKITTESGEVIASEKIVKQ